MSDWITIIGLEIHVQAKTSTKVFCSCKNVFGQEPNTNTCPVCLGHPGVLPVVSKEAIEQIMRAGLMTNCEIAKYSKFDRKSYFYPDQPKNYQITQLDLPFCSEGKIPIGGKGLNGDPVEEREIGLERIHLEEDVGKSTHFANHSMVDYNRAGMPLLETVSHPDMHSADEAYAYVQSLQQIMRYGGISDCDQEKGQFRCDVNISVHKAGTPFNTKVEIKNLNSTRHIWQSINYEIERQTEIYENGGTIRQETRRWNDTLNETVHMRFKESADDYRYFPEPDLVPTITTEEEIEALRANLPKTPRDYRKTFVEDFKVTEYDAHVLTLDKVAAEMFLAAGSQVKKPKGIANIMMNQLNSVLSDAGKTLADSALTADHLVKIDQLISDSKIMKNAVSDILPVLILEDKCPEAIAKEKGLIQENDSAALEGFVDAAIAANPKAVADYQGGNPKAIQSLMGQVMKASKGKANPGMVIPMLKKKLD